MESNRLNFMLVLAVLLQSFQTYQGEGKIIDYTESWHQFADCFFTILCELDEGYTFHLPMTLVSYENDLENDYGVAAMNHLSEVCAQPLKWEVCKKLDEATHYVIVDINHVFYIILGESAQESEFLTLAQFTTEQEECKTHRI